MFNEFLSGANLPVVIEALTVVGGLLALSACVTAVIAWRKARQQPTWKSAWKRCATPAAIVAALIGLLLVDAQYLSMWQSTQVAYYNYGIKLYTAGDHPCEKEELKDPIGNKCLDLEKGIKAFHTSILVYVSTKDNPDWVQKHMLPEPSQSMAAEAALHEGLLWIMAQKSEDAVKALKIAIMLSEAPDPMANATPEQKHQMLLHPTPEYLAYLAVKSVQINAQYDLELLFKKNPSQSEAEGKGKPKPGQGQPKNGPSTPDQTPSPDAGKGDRNAI